MVIRNFLFHRVSDDVDALWPPMRPILFERTIRELVRKYEIICLESFLQTQDDRKFSKPVASILFDDGYKDNIAYAAPILQKYNCPASFYVVTDCINRNCPPWTYQIDFAFQYTKIDILHLTFDYVPAHLKRVPLSDKARIAEIKPWLKKISNVKRVEMVQEILSKCYDVTPPRNKMMNWDDIRDLKKNGFSIGSHSHTHPMLAALESEKEIEEELDTSADILGSQLGERPLTISYPIGSYDERVTRIAAETGYKFGLAVDQRSFRLTRDPLMAIPRVELYQEPWWKVQLRIRGVIESIKRIWP